MPPWSAAIRSEAALTAKDAERECLGIQALRFGCKNENKGAGVLILPVSPPTWQKAHFSASLDSRPAIQQEPA
jgi:hypothetical protein